MECQAVWLPKRGNTAEEYEDAFASDPSLGRFAVADGATGGYFARPWAAALVRSFVDDPDCRPEDWLANVSGLQQKWSEQFQGKSLSWYAEEKVAEGAFATFLGLALEKKAGGGAWNAVAVGDSCLFRVGGGALRDAFPIARADDFNTSPSLLGSRSSLASMREKQLFGKGEWAEGDRFWLMTDALARWFLQACEAEELPWEDLELAVSAASTEAGFPDWIEELRRTQRIANDDVTLVSVVP